jgi:organic hydroperoxide reductase OsmC/OhrA
MAAACIANVIWERGGENFVDGKYSRRHFWRFDGGAEILGSSSPAVVRPPLSDPAGVDPEEAFIASLASCHMLWFLALAAKRKFCVDRYADAVEGVVGRNAAGKVALLKVTLRPAAAFSGAEVPTHAQIEQLHHEAHELCFIANSVTSEVLIEPVFGDS